MLSKRLIVCLDVRSGKLAKSVQFVDTKDIGDPIEKARQYYEDGIDELGEKGLLFEAEDYDIAREEWRGMPEFVQEKQQPYAQIIVRIASKEDLDAFADKMEQYLTSKTKSIWFPARSHWSGIGGRVRWRDES